MKILLIDIGNTETKFYLYEKKFTKKIKLNSDKLNFNYQIPRFRTQDFTIEWWMNPADVSGNYRGLITLTSSTSNDRFETAFLNNRIYIYTDTGAWRDTGWEPVLILGLT